MSTAMSKRVFCGWIALLLCVMSSNSLALGETTRVSVNSSGGQFLRHSPWSSISANGRYVVFTLANNSFTLFDIFVHDRVLKHTKLIFANLATFGPPPGSICPSISYDGRFVAFNTIANNLVSGDTNNTDDIFIHDLVTKQTVRASVDSNAIQANEISQCVSSLDADGSNVAFFSDASNLVADDTNNSEDVFVYNRLTKQTTRVSISSNGNQGDVHSQNPSLSADGRYVAFDSQASNLVDRDSNFVSDVFVHDRQTKKTVRVSVDSSGMQSNEWSQQPSISANGRYVSFVSFADNLVAKDTNLKTDVFVYDLLTKQVTRVSVSSNGIEANDFCYAPSLSADGRYVAFSSIASNLVAGDTNNTSDIFVHDRITKKTTRVSTSTTGMQGNDLSVGNGLSADGRFVKFFSVASNLVAGDTNNRTDAFVRDRWLDPTHKADLQITSSQKPTSLTVNTLGSYVYSITNNGPDVINSLRIQHIVSNGQVMALIPSKGVCSRYTSISLCSFGNLPVNANVTLQANIKAIRNPLGQQLTAATGGIDDPVPTNNYLTIQTPVRP